MKVYHIAGKNKTATYLSMGCYILDIFARDIAILR